MVSMSQVMLTLRPVKAFFDLISTSLDILGLDILTIRHSEIRHSEIRHSGNDPNQQGDAIIAERISARL